MTRQIRIQYSRHTFTLAYAINIVFELLPARANGEVFVLLYVFLFLFFLFGQRFLDNSRADSRQSSHAGVLWFRMSSPFWGVGGPRRAEKGANEISLLWESTGNFCILAVFERYPSNTCTDPHQILFVYGQCLPTCPLPLWDPSAPGGRGEGS